MLSHDVSVWDGQAGEKGLFAYLQNLSIVT